MFGNGDKKAEEVPATSKTQEAQKFLLAEDSVVNGDISTNEPAVINGTVEGSVTIENTLNIGAKGAIRGPVYVALDAKIDGVITGDLTCKGAVVLSATASLTGDVQCTSLILTKGAYFCGKVVCTEVK
ncbi:MAG: polymer-forming cytoskeletal protein [Phascolarctobacterium sp.]|nr:polymer-forming cytoskeletal protein [Phascolarctobacterium sp.]